MRKIIPIVSIILFFLCLFLIFVTIPARATRTYGPPAAWLTLSQRLRYSTLMLWYDGLLTRPLDPLGAERPFPIDSGESVASISIRLQDSGLIRNAGSFRDYLIYSGLDTSIQAGSYQLSPAMSVVDIVHEIQDATLNEVKFVIFPGWRMEEIAAALSTSGLPVTGDEFASLVESSSGEYDFLADAKSSEGFLFPDSYILPRTTSAEKTLDEFLRNFALHLTPDLEQGFKQQGLTVYQAVSLASIVEREAVKDDEKVLIASVYLNRLAIGMKLDADPTVQYALGFNSIQNTWWSNPLGAADLHFDSPFNTYVYAGLPPAPISNPGLTSLQAVANPSQSPYYYFQAKCDGSGYHSFAETFEEHVANGCG